MSKNELYYILNEKNKFITKEFIESLLKKYGCKIKIKDIELFRVAMTHISYLIRDSEFYKNNKTKLYQVQSTDIEPIDDLNKAIPLQKESLETLEYLGDAVVHHILAYYLLTRYRGQDEGFLTKLRTKIENGDTLSILSKAIGLNEYVMISRNVELNGGREKVNILEDCFEAFIGALSFETNFETCRDFVIKVIESEIDMPTLLYQETNFKEKLSQFFHTRHWQDPYYDTLNISGPENKKVYTMYVKLKKLPTDEGEIISTATGSSKKQGEQLAAKLALNKFGLYLDNEQEDEEWDVISNSDEEYESISEEEKKKDITPEMIVVKATDLIKGKKKNTK